MMTKLRLAPIFAPIFAMALVAAGCGQGVGALEAVGMGDDPLPALNLSSSGGLSGTQVYSSSNPSIRGSAGGVIAAPADGFVESVANNGGVYTVTLFHSFRVRTSFGLLNSQPPVRIGDYVTAGSALTSFGSNFEFRVLVDGESVCPLSYLSVSGRIALNAMFGGSPCQN